MTFYILSNSPKTDEFVLHSTMLRTVKVYVKPVMASQHHNVQFTFFGFKKHIYICHKCIQLMSLRRRRSVTFNRPTQRFHYAEKL